MCASAPRVIAQVVYLGSTILGKAFVQAWRQAARNARAGGEAASSGAGAAGGRGQVDALTRNLGMTLDEAANILNVQRTGIQAAEETELQKMLKNFDHLFKANAPLTAEGKPHSSHYLQSKIVRAKERIEAEMKGAMGGGPGAGPSAEGGAAAGGEAAGPKA
ncbi:import motor complex subunit PAM16 [Rhodotorula paludigena]|uniref:import motor complex subunit PAM16 n=1 Tax=Rhodotorula paludigena TaxID=86838 RepID=UPI003172B4AF